MFIMVRVLLALFILPLLALSKPISYDVPLRIRQQSSQYFDTEGSTLQVISEGVSKTGSHGRQTITCQIRTDMELTIRDVYWLRWMEETREWRKQVNVNRISFNGQRMTLAIKKDSGAGTYLCRACPRGSGLCEEAQVDVGE